MKRTPKEVLGVDIDLIKIIHQGIDNKPPQAWPVHGGGLLDRSKFVTASQIGTCARMQAFNMQQAPTVDTSTPVQALEVGYTKTKSTDDWGFWERGHNVERWIVETLLAGWEGAPFPEAMGDAQVSFIDGNQSGTSDGRLVLVELPNAGLLILEFKSIDPRTNTSRLPKVVHIDQVMQNLDLVSNALNISPIGGILLYVNASNYKEMHQFPVKWNEQHAAELEARADLIANSTPEELKAEGMFNGGCTYCNHKAACSAIIRKENNGENYDTDLKGTSGKLFG